MDYLKLISDLREAKTRAETAASKSDDGGSANLDQVVLRLPRARETKVLEAIKEAGLYCLERRNWFGSGYFIGGIRTGQGNKNTVAVEAMKNSLNENGWDAMVYYKID